MYVLSDVCIVGFANLVRADFNDRLFMLSDYTVWLC